MDALAKESVAPTWKQSCKYNVNEKLKGMRSSKPLGSQKMFVEVSRISQTCLGAK
jgi:hypothetical protein